MANKQQKTKTLKRKYVYKTLIEQHKTHRKTLVIFGAPRGSAYFFPFHVTRTKNT